MYKCDHQSNTDIKGIIVISKSSTKLTGNACIKKTNKLIITVYAIL